ncbi:Phospholipid scramblase 2 [Orchesella cincta]|uniref:Phospholipid scramblase n=1 Tax=Orchesella cincta TaxID=48709 RepID=A0A1D2MQV4_ORCCI|nr:Phospholipid scramblase 2 [Orchesella cincta]
MEFQTPSIFKKPPEPDTVDDSLSIEEVLPTTSAILPPADLERIRTWNEVNFNKRFKALTPPNKVTYYYGMKLGYGDFLSFKKTSGCKCPCFPCARPKIKVFDSLENFVGTVSPKCPWFCCCSRVKLVGKDATGKVHFKVKWVDCCGTSKFQIFFPKKSTPVGTIEDFPDSAPGCDAAGGDCPPNFGASFDSSVNVRDKALMIGAALLVDYMYFKPPKRSKSGGSQRMGSFSSRRV